MSAFAYSRTFATAHWSAPLTTPVSSLAPSGAMYSAHAEDIVDQFYNQLRIWRRETYSDSTIAAKMRHPAFAKIVAMGSTVVPFIIRELRTNPDFLFLALPILTRENPVPPQAAGKVREVINAWLAWAERTHPDVR
ncbi:MAG: hypothetical protein K8S25_14330 [Alphaproteobacteria bacterium]|nr:hypothetical protein [Alphaproteobacteria bacterium]